MGGNYMRPRTLYAVTVDNINKTCGQIITWKPKDGKAIEDYGNRIFRSPGFTRSLTDQERKLRDLPA